MKSFLESIGFQPKSGALVDTEHQIHVLNSLAYSTFQQVVDGRGDEELVAIFLHMHQRLVSVYHLLQVNRLLAVVREGSIGVEVLVGIDDILNGGGCANDGGAEDAAREVAAIRDEVDVGIQIALNLLQRLPDFGNMLMLERLVDTEVIDTPREMCGRSGLLSGTRRACDGIHGNVLFQQIQVGGRQKGQLNGRGKAAGVGYMAGLCNLVLVYLGQAINVVVCAFDAEILRQIDNLHAVGNDVLFQELLTLAVAETEEDDINLMEGHLVGEPQVGVANKPFVHVRYQIASVALRIGKHNLCLGMIEQQADEFAASITGGA